MAVSNPRPPAISEWEYILIGGALVGNPDALELHAKGYPYADPDHEDIVSACAVFFALMDPSTPESERRTRRDNELAALGYSQEVWGHWFLACEARFNDWEDQQAVATEARTARFGETMGGGS